MAWWAVEDNGAWSAEQVAGVNTVAQFRKAFGVSPAAGPFSSQPAADRWLASHGHAGTGGGGGGTPSPSPPSGGKTPQPGKLATFGQWKAWIDSRAPGQGDVWISWVESHAKITPPESGTVDLNSNEFPAGGTFLKGNTTDNHASNWFAAWILLGNVGPDIAKLLAGTIGGAGSKIPGVLKDVGTGISKVPGAQALGGLQAIGGFFSSLAQANTWIRVAEVLIGIALIGIGVARITGAENAISSAVKNMKVIPV